MNEKVHLGIINLAGIHDFIGESRKLVELHYGSKITNNIVSQIVTGLMKDSKSINNIIFHLKEKLGKLFIIKDFIIPPGDSVGTENYNYPNQLLFEFFGNPKAANVEMALRDFLKEYFSEKGEESLELCNEFKDFEKEWLAQWQDCLPIYFTSVEMNNDNFAEHHGLLQKKLVVHKLNRRFEQWQGGASVLKCIQCGHREIIGPTLNSKLNTDFWGSSLKRYIQRGTIKPSERLCAVCFGKRVLAIKDEGRKNIPTTTFMAALPFLKKLNDVIGNDKNESVGKAWAEFNKKIKKINEYLPNNFLNKYKNMSHLSDITELKYKSNAEWFYEDYYVLNNFEGVHTCNSNDDFNALLIQGRNALHSLIRKTGVKPSKYIALIEYDGDKMGKKRGSLGLDELKMISKTISTFSEETIQNIFNSGNGFLIYSGGEDVLGFASMPDAINLICDVNTSFLAKLNGITPVKFTGSGSITFFPYNFPLQEALNISDKNIHYAKEDFDRDSLVVGCVLKDSSQFIFGSKWKVIVEGEEEYSVARLLSETFKWFKYGKVIDNIDPQAHFIVSRRFLYDVLEIIKLFYDKGTGQLSGLTKRALEQEMVRLMIRHLEKDASKINQNIREKNFEYLKNACEEYVKNIRRVVLERSNLKETNFGLTNMEAFFKLIDFYVSRVEV